jgi:hypothetical protein
MTDMKEVWEILVPCTKPNGKPNSTRFHRVWDDKVKIITGGLTVCEPTKGQWVAPTGETVSERMIPIRIVCTRYQIDKIVDMTIEYYDQEAVLAYKISNEVILRYRK